MPNWISSSGAFAIYGALLALTGGVLAAWLQHRWDRQEVERRRLQTVLLEMIDIILSIRMEWLSEFVLGSESDLTTDQMKQFVHRFLADLTRLGARAYVVGNDGIIAKTDLIGEALQFWVELPPKSFEREAFKAEVTQAFDLALQSYIDMDNALKLKRR